MRYIGKKTTKYLFTGQQDDARMNLAIALTAARHGATIANHVSVTKLYKTAGKLSGARLRVSLTSYIQKV